MRQLNKLNSSYANVEFKTVEEAQKALDTFKATKFHGQPIYVDFDRKANDPSPYQVQKKQNAYDSGDDEGKENNSAKKTPNGKAKVDYLFFIKLNPWLILGRTCRRVR